DPSRLARQLLQASAEVLNVSRGAIYLREGSPPLYRLVDSVGPTPPLAELSSGCPVIELAQERNTFQIFPGRTAGTSAERQLRFLGGQVAHAVMQEDHMLALLLLGPKNMATYSPEDFNLLAALSQLTALALKSAERHRTIETLNKDLQGKVEKIS